MNRQESTPAHGIQEVEINLVESNEPHLMMDYTGTRNSKFRYRYSTTENTGLISTTVRIFGDRYCAHCGAKAFSVQAAIEKFNNYDVTDYRCTCKSAVEEIYQRLAISLFGDSFVDKIGEKLFDLYTNKHTIKDDLLAKILANRKPLTMHDLQHYSKDNGQLFIGSVSYNVKARDIQDARKPEQYVSNSDVRALVTAVDNYIDQLQTAVQERAQKICEDFDADWKIVPKNIL